MLPPYLQLVCFDFGPRQYQPAACILLFHGESI